MELETITVTVTRWFTRCSICQVTSPHGDTEGQANHFALNDGWNFVEAAGLWFCPDVRLHQAIMGGRARLPAYPPLAAVK